MKTENLNPPDEPRIKVCPECRGLGISIDEETGDVIECKFCKGEGEIIIDEE